MYFSIILYAKSNSCLLRGKYWFSDTGEFSFTRPLPAELHHRNSRDVETQAQNSETSLAEGHVHIRSVSCCLNVKVSILLYINAADSAKGVHITLLKVLYKKLFQSLF